VRFRFADFTLDTATRQLLLNGGDVHLTPKAFDLLELLLTNRARAVSKADLQRELWPDTFVEETNLASLVAEIRRALQDRAAAPRFIGTIYGFGYRFVGAVTGDQARDDPAPGRLTRCLIVDRRELRLMSGTNVIGRAADATIQVDYAGVSRHHARILVADDRATLEDAGSKNGTYLNGRRITAPVVLADGNEIRLGSVTIAFRVSTEASPTATVPADTD
jgi:DNA-binding winged helix-turn-helix (wHTH) protein